MIWHNQLRDVFAEACHRAHFPVRIEMGSGLTPDHNHSRPADVLVEGWERGKPAMFDITVTSPLCPAFLGEASQVAGAAALAAETRKHMAKRCQELGWAACAPIAVETYGNWGQEAKQTFSQLASRLATDSSQPKSKVIADLYPIFLSMNVYIIKSKTY